MCSQNSHIHSKRILANLNSQFKKLALYLLIRFLPGIFPFFFYPLPAPGAGRGLWVVLFGLSFRVKTA